jgi:hypothetical protein
MYSQDNSFSQNLSNRTESLSETISRGLCAEQSDDRKEWLDANTMDIGKHQYQEVLPHICHNKNNNHQQKQQPQSQQMQTKQGTMYAVQIQWTGCNGQPGIYSGHVNEDFLPHGHGTMVYNADGFIKEGEWENGRYQRSKRCKASGNGSQSQQC